MSKRVAAIQSCYVPWRGFFDLVSRCDEYIIYDQVAYRSGHWHNRNRIKTTQGVPWLTIPVNASLSQPIEEVTVGARWADKHWKSIEQAYSRAPHFGELAPWLKALYAKAESETLLTSINEIFLRAIFDHLGIKARIVRDRDYPLSGKRSERVLNACLAAGATHYVSGPTAKSYLETSLFEEAGIGVEWIDYVGYPEYPQLHGPFVSTVSIIDVLFNLGPLASKAIERVATDEIKAA